MVRFAPALAASAAMVLAAAGPAGAADGAQLFQLMCHTCHQSNSTPMGPSLVGVAGRKIAGAPGFAYSPALKIKGGIWTDQALDTFLTSPGKFAPGTRMPAAVAAPGDRMAIIAYLKTLK